MKDTHGIGRLALSSVIVEPTHFLHDIIKITGNGELRSMATMVAANATVGS
jgi:hypothetical protein